METSRQSLITNSKEFTAADYAMHIDRVTKQKRNMTKLLTKALLQGIARDEKAIEEGRVLTHAQAEKHMARWLSQSRRPSPPQPHRLS